MITDFLSELTGLLQKGRVLDDPELLVSYSTAMRGASGRAGFVVEPHDVSEVSIVAAWAYRHRMRLVVQGSNSGLVGASTPDDSGEQGVLSLRRLDQISNLDISSKTVEVEGGVTLQALNEHLHPHRLFLPVEVGSNPTVGGMVATNAGGAHTIRWGSAGERVLGVEAVVADSQGSLVGSLRRPRKDNSRLDVSRMMIGSYGSLGVIVRARLALADVPQTRATALLAFDSYESVPRLARLLAETAGDSLLAFEMISGEAMRLTLANVDGVPHPFGSHQHICYVLVEIGSDDNETDLDGFLARTLDELSSRSPGLINDGVIAPPSDLWRLRHSLSEGTKGPGSTLRFDISMNPDDLPSFRRRLGEEADLLGGPLISEFGHWADGGTHLQLLYPSTLDEDAEEAARFRVYDLVVREFNGSFSAEHGLGPFNAVFYERFVPASERRLGRRLKMALDPRGVWGRAPIGS